MEEEEEEEVNFVPSLPTELWGIILSYLTIHDYIHTSLVCKSWFRLSWEQVRHFDFSVFFGTRAGRRWTSSPRRDISFILSFLERNCRHLKAIKLPTQMRDLDVKSLP